MKRLMLIALVLLSGPAAAVVSCSPPQIPSGDGLVCIEPQHSDSTDTAGIPAQYIFLMVGCALMFGMGANFGKSS